MSELTIVKTLWRSGWLQMSSNAILALAIHCADKRLGQSHSM